MILAGMNVARLNFSHGSYKEHKKRIDTIKELRNELNMPVAILLDTKGPEIRIGEMDGGAAEIVNGQEFVLTTVDMLGNSERAPISYKDLPPQLKKGQRILMDDGRLILEVKSTTDTDVICTVLEGGVLETHKSVNVPNTHLNMPYMSKADEDDVLFVRVQHNLQAFQAKLCEKV